MSSKWILSATEIETFETCRRKWAYQYLDGIKPPQSKAAEFGLAVHGLLEKHLTGYAINYETPEGRVASAGLRYLPHRLPRENVERPIFFLKQGKMFHGYIDFFEQVGSQTWLVGDHKTSSTLSRALTSAELKKNTQANIYAQWAFVEKGAEAVKLRWVYYRTQSIPKALSVEAELTKDDAEENFAHIATVADDILNIVKEKSSSSAQPRNLSSCFKYGRCPFYTQCKSAQKTTAHPLEIIPTQAINDEVKEFNLNSSCDPKQKSFHLYIDCIPTKSDGTYARTIELSDLLKPVLTKIQTEKELSHYRLAGYGQHVGLIANYLREHLATEAYDDNTAILSSVKTPEGCDTLQTLTSQAGLVVRGF